MVHGHKCDHLWRQRDLHNEPRVKKEHTPQHISRDRTDEFLETQRFSLRGLITLGTVPPKIRTMGVGVGPAVTIVVLLADC